MNIFVTHSSPILSAWSLDDKRLIKMVLESAQLLSSAIFLKSKIIHKNIYRPTHLHHPCTIWASTNKANWLWLFDHFKALCSEYSYRYHKKHKTQSLIPNLKKHSSYIKNDSPISPFANCTRSEKLKVDFRNHPETIIAYRQYLSAKWDNDINPKWTRRFSPVWYSKS